MYADKPAKQRYEKVYFPPINQTGLVLLEMQT